MSKPSGKIDWRPVAVAVTGGAAILAASVQLMAKPKLPPMARAAARPAAAQEEGGVTVRTTDVASFSGITAEPPIRNLFRPLVTPPGQNRPAPIPTAPPPSLPTVKPAPAPAPAASRPPAAGAPSLPPAAVPSGPRAEDIQMFGVVELDGQPQALLRNRNTGERRYFAKGDEAFGFKVEEIQESEVGLALNGRTERVRMSNEVVLEGPGSGSAGSSTFSASSNSFGGGRFGSGGFGRDRGDRGDRGDRNRDRGGSSGGPSGGSSGFSTAQIMSLPTWTARLEALEKIKGQLEADRYERLHKFMSGKAAEEKGGK